MIIIIIIIIINLVIVIVILTQGSHISEVFFKEAL